VGAAREVFEGVWKRRQTISLQRIPKVNKCLSAFVPLRNTYLNFYESIRGQGESRKTPSLNVSFTIPGFRIHPPQQELARISHTCSSRSDGRAGVSALRHARPRSPQTYCRVR
jgi:hypothetical protein